MKKWKQVVLVAALALLLGLTTKVETQAAVTISQSGAGTSSIDVKCETVMAAKYYFLEISDDGKQWFYKDYSTNPNNLSASGLTAGRTYYARVIPTTDWTSENGTYIYTPYACADASAPLEVVTVPDSSYAKLVQKSATLNSVTMELTGVQGANYYFLATSSSYSTAQAIGTSTTSRITAGSLRSNTSYTIYAYACRKAATTGFIAHPTYDSDVDYSAKTLTGKINKSNFGITSAWSNINSYTFAVSSGFAADGYEFQFQNMKGKVKKTVVTTSTSTYVDAFINGTFYKYRVRPYVDCGGNRVPGQWSDFRYIGMSKDVNGTSTTKGKKRTLRLSWKKVSGASKYIVYISKSEKGGYKKVKTLSSKKNSVKITKYGKKKLKKNTKYYIKLVVKGKSGKKTVSSDVSKIMTSTY
ncbi:MAG: hypothetical protein NC489_38590 [Ruminococcus flavefaciens]|nr:hypothetical protein [Ruminococcus flavefaciens]